MTSARDHEQPEDGQSGALPGTELSHGLQDVVVEERHGAAHTQQAAVQRTVRGISENEKDIRLNSNRKKRLLGQRKTQYVNEGKSEEVQLFMMTLVNRFYQLCKFQFFSYFLVDLLGLLLNGREPEGHHAAC